MISTTERPQTCYNLGPAARIPLGEGRVFLVDDRSVAIFRSREGGVHAVQADCSHRGGPLADGLIGNGQVICPLHGHKYCLKSGRPLGHANPALETYRVETNRRGEILLYLSR